MPIDHSPIANSIAGILLTACFATGCVSQSASHVSDGITPIDFGGPDDLLSGESSADLPLAKKVPEATSGNGSVPETWHIRGQHQREACLRFGSQSGFRHRVLELREVMQSRSGQLSVVYDFNRLARPVPGGAGYLVPPIVQRAENAFRSDGDERTVSVADIYFQILKPERLAPVAPTWRDWLLFDPPQVNPLPMALIPVNDEERGRVEAWYEQGWRAGLDQAEGEFRERLRRLRRDYEGMLEFRKLAAQGMIGELELAVSNFGVTGGAGEMRIGNRTVGIIGTADFRRNPENWRTSFGPEPTVGTISADEK